MESGQLREISPTGTGFIELESGRVLGFHHSMLQTFMPRELWSTLEGREVAFELRDGVAHQVRLSAQAKHSLTAVGSL